MCTEAVAIDSMPGFRHAWGISKDTTNDSEPEANQQIASSSYGLDDTGVKKKLLKITADFFSRLQIDGGAGGIVIIAMVLKCAKARMAGIDGYIMTTRYRLVASFHLHRILRIQ